MFFRLSQEFSLLASQNFRILKVDIQYFNKEVQ